MVSRSLVFLLVILFSSAPASSTESPLPVFVSVPPQRYLVERIGGDHVDVRVMLPAGQSPETFDPTMRQLQALAGSRIYFLAGVPFEDSWAGKIRRSYPELKLVACREEMPDRTGPDPHIWTSPARASELAACIFRVLAGQDPDRKRVYADNLEALQRDLNALDNRARREFADRRTDYFITIHASWGHFARDYGLKEISMEHNGREAGLKGMAGLLDIARREGLDTLFVQPHYRSPMVRTLAAEINAEVKILDPLAENYLENMHLVIERIAGALR